MAISVCLRIKNSDEAVEVYKSAFSLELGYNVKNDDGTYFHSELMKGDEEIMSVVEADNHESCRCVMLGFTFTSRSGLENAFNILKKNGKVTMDICELPWSPYAAEVVDRFGICWYLSLPQHHPDENFDIHNY